MIEKDWQLGLPLGLCFREVFENGLWTDVSFTFKNCQQGPQEIVKAHKIVLAARSPVFQAMFYGPVAEKSDSIELIDCDSVSFTLFLEFLYTDISCLTEDTVPSVMTIAHKYQVTKLLEFCSDYLISVLRVDNACAILELALFFDEKELEKKTLEFIDDLGEKVIKSDTFLEIKQSTLEHILKGDTLLAWENEIFEAVMAWAEQQCENKSLSKTGENMRKLLGGAFQYLRLPTLSIEEFSRLTYRKGYLSYDELEETMSYITGNSEAEPYNNVKARRCRKTKIRPKHKDPKFEGRLDFGHFVNVTTIVKVKAKESIKLTGFAMSSLIKSPTSLDFINPMTKYTVGVSVSRTECGDDLLFTKMFCNNVRTHYCEEFPLVVPVNMTASMELYLIFHIMSDPGCMVRIPELKSIPEVPFGLAEPVDHKTPPLGMRVVEVTYLDSFRFLDFLTFESPSNR